MLLKSTKFVKKKAEKVSKKKFLINKPQIPNRKIYIWDLFFRICLY